jgi:hypothetical protein
MLVATDLPALFRETRALLAILADHTNPMRASDAAAHALASLDRALSAGAPVPALACRKGCAYCCWNWVGATAPEIFLLARTLRRQEGTELAATIRAAAAPSEGVARVARLAGRHPCAVLENDLCSAYAARPLVCRATVSTSLDACIVASQGGPDAIPVPSQFVALRGGHDQCLWAALTETGLPDTSYELNAALALVIDDPAAEQRWLAGEDVFAGIPVDGEGDAPTREFGRLLVAGARKEQQL